MVMTTNINKHSGAESALHCRSYAFCLIHNQSLTGIVMTTKDDDDDGDSGLLDGDVMMMMVMTMMLVMLMMMVRVMNVVMVVDGGYLHIIL